MKPKHHPRHKQINQFHGLGCGIYGLTFLSANHENVEKWFEVVSGGVVTICIYTNFTGARPR